MYKNGELNMSQVTELLKHLKEGKVITQRKALHDLNIAALPRRIVDLKECGWKIDTKMKKNPVTGRRYAEYSLQQ